MADAGGLADMSKIVMLRTYRCARHFKKAATTRYLLPAPLMLAISGCG
jgi:hypothetical protein